MHSNTALTICFAVAFFVAIGVLCSLATREPPCRGRHITGTVGIARVQLCITEGR